MKFITRCIVFLLLGLPTALFAEIGAPSEPVGNATDKVKPEPPRKVRKKRKLTAEEKAHQLAHKKKKVKRKLASPKKPKPKRKP